VGECENVKRKTTEAVAKRFANALGVDFKVYLK